METIKFSRLKHFDNKFLIFKDTNVSDKVNIDCVTLYEATRAKNNFLSNANIFFFFWKCQY